MKRPHLAVSSTAALVAVIVSGCADRAAPQGEAHGDGPLASAGEATTAAETCVTIQRGGGVGNVFDSGINDNGVSSNNSSGTSGTIPIGDSGSPTNTPRQELMSFDLSPITSLPGASSFTVVGSQVSLYLFPNTANQTINVHQATAAWSEGTVSWPSFNESYVATPLTSFNAGAKNSFPSASPPNNVRFDVTSLVNGWLNGTLPEDGILLEQPPVTGVSAVVLTSEYPPATSGYHPTLFVCFTTTCAPGTADCNNNGADGCETNITTTQNCGSCGNACAAGATCQNGACVQNPCANVVCPPIDACHAAGACDPANGQCVAGASLADTATALAHRWTFDEASGATALDSAGADNGTLGSSVTRVTSFDGSGAVSLDPESQCDLGAAVDFGTDPGNLGTADFTVSYWVATSYSGPEGLGDLIGNRTADSNGEFISGRLRSDGTSSIEIDNSGVNYEAAELTTPLNDSRWHNVVYTRSGPVLTAYVDGVLQSSFTGPGTTDIIGQSPFRVGLSLPECPYENYAAIPALFDDVRIYGRALDQCDVSSLAARYAGAPASPPSPPIDSCDAEDPCGYGFNCVPGPSGATCVADPCIPSPCQNGGACSDVGSGYTCQCSFPYLGTNCESAYYPPTCPCDFTGSWVVDECAQAYSASGNALVLVDSGEHNGFVVYPQYALCETISSTGGSTSVSGLDATEIASCTADLLAYDTANFCGQCVADCPGAQTECLYNPSGDNGGNVCQ
jgi:Concanavalin A-like lectin/glucanases superfamily